MWTGGEGHVKTQLAKEGRGWAWQHSPERIGRTSHMAL